MIYKCYHVYLLYIKCYTNELIFCLSGAILCIVRNRINTGFRRYNMALLKKTKQVNTRFTEEEYNLLLLKARTERLTLSDFIRQAAVSKKVSLSGISVVEGQKVRCKTYDTGEIKQGIVKKDASGRLYIPGRGENSDFYPCKWDEVTVLGEKEKK